MITEHEAPRLPDTANVRFANAHGGTRVAQGLRVGNVFVRAAFANERAYVTGTGEIISAHGLWVVELPRAQIGLAFARSFDAALLMADELSRWWPAMHDATTLAEIERLVTDELVAWMRHVQDEDRDGRTPHDYRRWCQLAGLHGPRVCGGCP